MANIMTYSELSDLCYKKKKSLTRIADCANMTLRGFREGMNTQNTQVRSALPLAARLCRFHRSTSGRLLPTGRKKA